MLGGGRGEKHIHIENPPRRKKRGSRGNLRLKPEAKHPVGLIKHNICDPIGFHPPLHPEELKDPTRRSHHHLGATLQLPQLLVLADAAPHTDGARRALLPLEESPRWGGGGGGVRG